MAKADSNVIGVLWIPLGGASQEITDAYITYALTESGYRDLQPEIALTRRRAENSSDPYLLALAVNALLNNDANSRPGKELAKKLASLQQRDGRFHGTTHSITRSSGINLDVETTSLAIMALLKGDGYSAQLTRAIQWLGQNRRGGGGFGATQATILSIKALTLYAQKSRRTQAAGDIVVYLGAKEVARKHFSEGATDPIEITDLQRYLQSGNNQLRLTLQSQIELPYSVALSYNAITPANDPECQVQLQTTLAATKVKMGETVRLQAKIKNRTANGLPMTLVRIGIPGGLSLQTWQLKQLRDQKRFAFYETNAREAICYFGDLAPGAEIEVPLDLVATVPGKYSGPASSAYLYYSNDKKNWAAPVQVQIGK